VAVRVAVAPKTAPAPVTPAPAEEVAAPSGGAGAWRYGAWAGGALGLVAGGVALVAGGLLASGFGGVYAALYAHGLKLVKLPVTQKEYVRFDQNRLPLAGVTAAGVTVAALLGLVALAGGITLIVVPWMVGRA